jgi:hypothetical protein
MSLERVVIPRWLVIIGTVLLVFYYFVPMGELAIIEELPRAGSAISAWFIIGATAVYTIRLFVELRERKIVAWYINIAQLAMFFGFAAIGLTLGQTHSSYRWIQDYVIGPIGTTVGTIVCSMAFFPSSHRLMRVRGWDSAALMAGFLLQCLRLAPVIQAVMPPLADAVIWLETYPMTAARGAAFIGVSLSGIAIILRTMFGLSRGVT